MTVGGLVLIVDDDPAVVQLMERALRNHAVITASQGAEALALALANPPDLILLDVLLPDIDGIEVCRRVRAEPTLAEVPVIMSTALGDADSRLRSLEAGADDFITKPVDLLALRARVGSLLRLNRYRRLVEERRERQRAEEEILQRNHELSLLHQQLQAYVDRLETTVSERTSELQAERDRTRAILDALDEAVIVTDTAGVISYANPAMEMLSGYSSNELLGTSIAAVVGDDPTLETYRRITEEVLAGRTWRGEVHSIRRNGSVYEAMLAVAPIYDGRSGGRPSGMVGVQRDIEPLKAAERMKEQFMANASHELRTPLSIIALHSGNLDTLYNRLPDAQRRHLIRQVRFQADLLNELIGDVLELSRIDSGRILRSDEQPVDLSEVLAHEAGLLAPLAERTGLRLTVDCAAPLPVWADATALRRCVRNLIANAIKFSPSGGAIDCACRVLNSDSPNTTTWPGHPGGARVWAAVRVKDTGSGIAAEHLPHLWQRFYRVQDQTSVPGTGLGLAITRELITGWGGFVGVASTPGVGSTFAFYLPLVEVG